MIICPRCGYQAPDGSPWCPRCGYGCPYPMQQQQLPPQQMPAVYQPQPQYQAQQEPPQYDIYDLPPQTPKKKTKKRKKKKSLFKKILLGIGIILGLLISGFVALVIYYGWMADTPETPTPTPNMETMVQVVNDQNATATMIVALSATSTFTPTMTSTNTPEPTYTPIPTNTPVPTDTPIPAAAWSSDQTYSDNNYAQTGSGVRGSVAQDTSVDTCTVKVSKNGIYHCKNSPNYNTMKEYTCFSSQAAAEAAGYKMSGNMGGWCAQ